MRFKLIAAVMPIFRLLLKVFYIFPINPNRVVLSSFKGVHYNCNPRYVAEALCDDGRRNYEIIFALRTPEKYSAIVKTGIKLVKYRSLKHTYYLMTAAISVENVGGIATLLPYRKQQKFINTWHGGGAFKTTGTASKTANKNMERIYSISGKNVDVFLSSSDLFTQTQSSSHGVPPRVFVNTGMPRNDLFFTAEANQARIRQKVRDALQVNADKSIVLYAPTYRDGGKSSIQSYGFEQIDVSVLLAALKERFGHEFVLLFRAHTNMLPEIEDERWMNVSNYPDMQELLCASDVLITDYSSCMWDFALQKKPGFLFAADYEYFKEHHTLFTAREDWPYELATNNQELRQLILDFDEQRNAAKICAYYKAAQCYETGTATRWVLDYIYNHTGSKKAGVSGVGRQ